MLTQILGISAFAPSLNGRTESSLNMQRYYGTAYGTAPGVQGQVPLNSETRDQVISNGPRFYGERFGRHAEDHRGPGPYGELPHIHSYYGEDRDRMANRMVTANPEDYAYDMD